MYKYVNRPCAVQGYDDLTCGQYIGLIHKAVIDGELVAVEYYLRLAQSNNAIYDLMLASKEIRAEQQQQAQLSDEWEDQLKTRYGASNPFASPKKSGTYTRVLPGAISPPIKKKMFP